jgi:hypothetical protein
MYWSIDPHAESITVTLEGVVTGVQWLGSLVLYNLGFGLSPDGNMPNSDMVLCTSYNGATTCVDRWASGHALPPLDTTFGGKENVQEVSGSLNSNGTLTFTFTRLLNTGD